MMTHNGLRRATLAAMVSFVLVGVSADLSWASDAKDTRRVGDQLRGFHTANGLLNRGLHELAADEYRTFLADHPKHKKAPVARYGLAVCLFRTGKYEEALEQLEPLAKRRGFDFGAEVGTMIGESRMALHRHPEAASAFRRVVDRFADHDLADDAAAGAIEALYRSGQFDESVRRSRDFVSRWPDSEMRQRAEFFWALSLMAELQYPAAAERLEDMVQRGPATSLTRKADLLLAQCYHRSGRGKQASEAYQRIIDDNKTSTLPDALQGLASVLLQQGKPAEAGVLLDRLLKSFPDSPLAQSARFDRARAWFDLGDYARARDAFEATATAESDLQDDARYWQAKCLLRQGRNADAAEQLRRCLSQFPGSDLRAEMMYDLAVAMFRAGDYEAAAKELADYRKAYREHSMAADALHLLALSRHRLKQFDRSQRRCREFLDQYGEHARRPDVIFLSAENNFLQGQYAAAAKVYQSFLDRFSDQPQARWASFRLGMAFYRLDRLDEARVQLKPFAEDSATSPEFRSATLALGDIAFQRERWNDARAYLEAYLSGGLDIAAADDALLKLGLSRQRGGLYAEAIDAYDRLIRHFPDSEHHLQAMFERGQALVAMGRSDDAGKAFEQVLAADKRSRFGPYALNHLGMIDLANGRFDRAADRFKEVVRTSDEDSFDASATLEQGKALLAGERFAAAEKLFRRFLERWPTHTDANDASARLAIAVARQERYDDALKLIAKSDQETAGKMDPSLRAALLYEKAWALRQLGRTDEAAGVYRQLLAAGTPKSNAYAMLELAAIEADAGRHESAAKLLAQVLELPRSGDAAARDLREQATYRMAVCEYEMSKFQPAARRFGEFIDEFPKSAMVASALFFCGDAQFKVKRYERASEHLARVTTEFSDDDVYPAALLRLGECAAQLQRWKTSGRAFSTFLERFADDEHWFQAQFGVGLAEENQQRYDQAIGSYRRVVDRHQGPTAARAQFQIGECCFAQKRYDDAIRELLKVDILYAYPEWSAAALYEAGRCFAKLAKNVEAREQFKTVVTKYKQTHWARLAGRELEAASASMVPGR